MRIVHLACVAPPEIGGIGQVAYDEVVGLRTKGIEAVLVTAEGSRHITSTRDEAIIRLPTLLRVGNAAVVRGVSEVMKEADIIHLHYPWYGVMECVLGCTSKKPIVVTFHMDATASDWRGWMFRLHRYLLQAPLLRRANKILVSSRDYAQQSSLKSLLPDIGDKLIELPFGVDTNFFSPLATPRSTLHASRSTILFVGGLDRAHSFKGLPILLDAMMSLSPATRLQIVGDGDQRSIFENRVKELNLRERVTFLGRVDRVTLRDQYREADVLAFPSVSAAEAFGMVVVEAQACGVPVVASRLPGVRTVLADGESGFLVPPGDSAALAQALRRLLTDEDLRRKVGEAARTRALQYYSQTVHIQRLSSLYQAL